MSQIVNFRASPAFLGLIMVERSIRFGTGGGAGGRAGMVIRGMVIGIGHGVGADEGKVDDWAME